MFKGRGNLWVKGRQETPHHGEDGGGVGGAGGRQLSHWTKVEKGGGAGKAAKLLVKGAGRVDVVVQPHAPALPIQSFHQSQVLLDPAPVLLLLVLT